MSAVRTPASRADVPLTPGRLLHGSPAAALAPLGLAGLAWWWTIHETHAMSSMVEGVAQMGIAMPFTSTAWTFIAMWVVMMAAMMLPTVLPAVAGPYVGADEARGGLLAALAFGVAYLGVWAAAGLVPLMFRVPPAPAPIACAASQAASITTGCPPMPR